ncbi:MAG: hypothetical protein WCJ35_17030 [Planctomycetota bacterium]
MPHPITQRGNRRQQTFFNDATNWSSARAHLSGRNDPLAEVAPLLAMIDDWNVFLKSAMPEWN